MTLHTIDAVLGKRNTYARWIAPHAVRECQAHRARPFRCI